MNKNFQKMTDNNDPIYHILNDENKENQFDLILKYTGVTCNERSITRRNITELHNFSESGILGDQSNLINNVIEEEFTIQLSDTLNVPQPSPCQEDSQIVIGNQIEKDNVETLIVQDTLNIDENDSGLQTTIPTGQISDNNQQDEQDHSREDEAEQIISPKETEQQEKIARQKSLYEIRVENLKKAREIRKIKKIQKQNIGHQLSRFQSQNKYGQKFKQSESKRAGLCFSVNRFKKMIKKSYKIKRVGPGASVYLTSVIEYLTAEILDLAGDAAFQSKKSRINPRHIMMAVKQDIEFNELLKDVTITSSGVLPIINKILTLTPEQRKKIGTKQRQKLTDDFMAQSGRIKRVNNEEQQQQKQPQEQSRQNENNGSGSREHYQERNEEYTSGGSGGFGDMGAGDNGRDQDNDDNDDANKKTSKDDKKKSSKQKETEETESESESLPALSPSSKKHQVQEQQQVSSQKKLPIKKRGRGRPKKDEVVNKDRTTENENQVKATTSKSKSRSRSRSKCIIKNLLFK
jgi:histone H2A